jgi:hypothetical protein
LIPEDAPHEYASLSLLVELAIDEYKCLCSLCDTSSLCSVEGKLSFDKPLEDQEPSVGIFKIQLGRLVNRHDFRIFNL